jgi:hypothetical protein
VWSASGEPGPRTLNGDSLLSLPTTRSAPQATPAAAGPAWYPHVRAYAFFGSVPCWRHAPHSRLTARELRRIIDEEDVHIHAIGIHDGSDRMDEARGPWILEDLAKMTGGQHHMVSSAAELPQLAAKMSLALHERYVLGYRPTPSGLSRTFRRIESRLCAERTLHGSGCTPDGDTECRNGGRLELRCRLAGGWNSSYATFS